MSTIITWMVYEFYLNTKGTTYTKGNDHKTQVFFLCDLCVLRVKKISH